MFHRHKQSIDDDAESDEEVDKRVHDEQFDDVGELIPPGTTLPPKQQLVALVFEELLLALPFFHAKKIWKNIRQLHPLLNMFNLAKPFIIKSVSKVDSLHKQESAQLTNLLEWRSILITKLGHN